MSGVQFNTAVSVSVTQQCISQPDQRILTPRQSVLWLCPNANSLEYVDHAHQARNLYERLDVDLGCGVCLHGASTELWWISRVPLLLGYYRSKFLLESLSLDIY
jgi:hypothetical protein